MKQYKTNIKGFSFKAFLIFVLIVGVAVYFALPIYQEKAAEPKFQALKELTQKVAKEVNIYHIIYGTYPKKMSDLNTGLNTAYEGPDFLIGSSDHAFCLIPTNFGKVSCTEKISGGRIGFLADIEDSSMKCIPFSKNTNHFTNRLCKKEFKDHNPLFDCDNYIYALNRYTVVRNNASTDCKRLSQGK